MKGMVGGTQRAAVISGCGWVTPFGSGSISEVMASLRVGNATSSPPDPFAAVPVSLVGEFPELGAELRRDKDAWMAGIALDLASRAAALDRPALRPERTGLVLGSALAGQLGMIQFANEVREQSPRFVSPIHFPQTVGNFVAGALARAFNITGPSLTVASGSASGLDAIIEGARLVCDGKAEIVFAGAVEQLSEAVVAGLEPSGVGFSEGACIFTIEDGSRAAARGVQPLAQITRWHHLASGTASSTPEPGLLLSATGVSLAGAVAIELAVGRCLGVGGAAAVAGLVAASRGFVVPIIDDGGCELPLPPGASIGDAGIPRDEPRGRVLASSDGESLTALELTLVRQGT